MSISQAVDLVLAQGLVAIVPPPNFLPGPGTPFFVRQRGFQGTIVPVSNDATSFQGVIFTDEALNEKSDGVIVTPDCNFSALGSLATDHTYVKIIDVAPGAMPAYPLGGRAILFRTVKGAAEEGVYPSFWIWVTRINQEDGTPPFNTSPLSFQ